MKIDRLIGILAVLLQQDKMTAPELAERFEVSRRTINRDIDDLCRNAQSGQRERKPLLWSVDGEASAGFFRICQWKRFYFD